MTNTEEKCVVEVLSNDGEKSLYYMKTFAIQVLILFYTFFPYDKIFISSSYTDIP